MGKHHYKRDGTETASKGEVICWNFHHDDYRIVRILTDELPHTQDRYEIITEVIR